MIRLPHPKSGDSQCQETFLVSSVEKQTRNYHTERSNHYPSQLSYSTGTELWQHKMVSHKCENLKAVSIVRLPHPRN